VLVDPKKIAIILHMPPPPTVKNLCTNLGHNICDHQFIKGYMSITTPLEKILKKYKGFRWTQYCDKAFDLLKQKMSTAPILTYANWKVEFHVHIDASIVALGTILTQLGKGKLDHPIYFSSHKLSQDEQKYTMTGREGLDMVYALQKFRNYLLGTHFMFFTDHSALKYLFNKPMLEGRLGGFYCFRSSPLRSLFILAS